MNVRALGAIMSIARGCVVAILVAAARPQGPPSVRSSVTPGPPRWWCAFQRAGPAKPSGERHSSQLKTRLGSRVKAGHRLRARLQARGTSYPAGSRAFLFLPRWLGSAPPAIQRETQSRHLAVAGGESLRPCQRTIMIAVRQTAAREPAGSEA